MLCSAGRRLLGGGKSAGDKAGLPAPRPANRVARTRGVASFGRASAAVRPEGERSIASVLVRYRTEVSKFGCPGT